MFHTFRQAVCLRLLIELISLLIGNVMLYSVGLSVQRL